MPHTTRRRIWSWAFYDWANSAFATTVIAGFFPVFFKQYWAGDQPVTESTFYLGLVNALASLVIVMLAPFLGALADQLSWRKKFLLLFAVTGILMSAGLGLLAQGAWLAALLLYFFALLGFSGSNIFYDALLLDVVSLKKIDAVSGLGFAMGYLGGAILFAFNVWMVSDPAFFGIADSAAAVKISFISVGIWWALFSLPLLLFVKEHSTAQQFRPAVLVETLLTLRQTLRHVSSLKQTFTFLLAYWFYIDGVDTIIRMAVDFGLSIGLESNSLLLALLVTQLVGFPAAILMGRAGEKFGPKIVIGLSLLVYSLIVVFAYSLQSKAEFFMLAVAVGLVQGGVQSLSRSLYARLIPSNKKAEFFGFYNMLGKFAAVVGPLLVGVSALLTDNSRFGILSVLLLFVTGGYLLSRVNIEKGTEDAVNYTLYTASEK